MPLRRALALSLLLLLACVAAWAFRDRPASLRESIFDPSTRERRVPVSIALLDTLPSGLHPAELSVWSSLPESLELSLSGFSRGDSLERDQSHPARWMGELSPGAYRGHVQLVGSDGVTRGPNFEFPFVVEGSSVELEIEPPRLVLREDLDVPDDAWWVPHTHREPFSNAAEFSLGSGDPHPHPSWMLDAPGHWHMPGVPMRTCLPSDPFPSDRVLPLEFDLRFPAEFSHASIPEHSLWVVSDDQLRAAIFVEPPFVIDAFPPGRNWTIRARGCDMVRVSEERLRSGEPIELVVARRSSPVVLSERRGGKTILGGMMVFDRESAIGTDWLLESGPLCGGMPVEFLATVDFLVPRGTDANGEEQLDHYRGCFHTLPSSIEIDPWPAVRLEVHGLPRAIGECAIAILGDDGNDWWIETSARLVEGRRVFDFAHVPPGRGFAFLHGAAHAIVPLTVGSAPIDRVVDVRRYGLIVANPVPASDISLPDLCILDERFDDTEVRRWTELVEQDTLRFGEPILLPRGTLRLFGRVPVERGWLWSRSLVGPPIEIEVGRETQVVDVSVPRH